MHPDGSTFINRIEGIQSTRAIATTELDNDTELKKADMQRFDIDTGYTSKQANQLLHVVLQLQY